LSSEQTYDERVENIATNVGIVAYMSGKRPSELFEWNDPEDWMERLMFDLEVCGLAYKQLVETQQVPTVMRPNNMM